MERSSIGTCVKASARRWPLTTAKTALLLHVPCVARGRGEIGFGLSTRPVPRRPLRYWPDRSPPRTRVAQISDSVTVAQARPGRAARREGTEVEAVDFAVCSGSSHTAAIPPTRAPAQTDPQAVAVMRVEREGRRPVAEGIERLAERHRIRAGPGTNPKPLPRRHRIGTGTVAPPHQQRFASAGEKRIAFAHRGTGARARGTQVALEPERDVLLATAQRPAAIASATAPRVTAAITMSRSPNGRMGADNAGAGAMTAASNHSRTLASPLPCRRVVLCPILGRIPANPRFLPTARITLESLS